MRTFLQVIGTLAGILATIYGALYLLFEDMTPARIAGIVTFSIVAGVAGILLTLVLVFRLSGRTRTPTDAGTRAIDATWDYKPPQAQLPQPSVITVPRLAVNGMAQPFNMPQHQAPVLRTQSESGAALDVPLDKLQRFLSLTTPARSEWTGDKTAYSACLQFTLAQGLLQRRAGENGYAWDVSYPTGARRRGAEQWCQR